MPAAPDLLTLYDFEDQLESPTAAILTAALAAAGITANVYTSQVLGIKTTPRIDVQFLPGRALNHRTATRQTVAKEVPDMFDGTLYCTVATTRAVDQAGNAPIHGKLRGLIRAALSAGKGNYNSTNMPYLQILDMLPEAAPHTLYDDKDLDLTAVAFFVQFGILDTAWP